MGNSQEDPEKSIPFEALSYLDGSVKAIREASPQARHNFTQADQVNQLVTASEADPDLGFMARMMALYFLLAWAISAPQCLHFRAAA